MDILNILGGINMTIPLPISMIFIWIAGAIYTNYQRNKLINRISKYKNDNIYESYLNCLPIGTKRELIYCKLDPTREMKMLSENWIVKFTSSKHSRLIYARILDCIETHNFMINNLNINSALGMTYEYNKVFFQNTLLFYFLIELLQLPKKESLKHFESFSNNTSYLYDTSVGYFKDVTTLSYKKTKQKTSNSKSTY